MQYRKLGNTGLKVSELCLGTMTFLWTSDEATSFAVLDRFRAAGGNFIDTADIYSRWAPNNPGGTAETVMGKWQRANRVPREQLVYATKARGAMSDDPNAQGLSRVRLVTAVEDSLRRLQTDYIDLYQMHWPDYDTPLDETLRALDDLTRAGKIRYIGASNFPAWYLTKALWVSDVRGFVRFESVQPHYNLMHRAEFEREAMHLAIDQKLAVIPYSPLAAGYLSGKYRRGQAIPKGTRGENNTRIQQYVESASGEATLDALAAIGAARGKSIAQTALAWLLSKPFITAPIVGASAPAQLEEALGAVGVRLSAEEMEQLDTVTAWNK